MFIFEKTVTNTSSNDQLDLNDDFFVGPKHNIFSTVAEHLYPN